MGWIREVIADDDVAVLQVVHGALVGHSILVKATIDKGVPIPMIA